MAIATSATSPANGTAGFHTFITVATSAGYKIPQYSDGITLTTPGSPLTSNPYGSSGSGAGNLGNSSAWFRLQAPDGSRELLFQRSTTDPVWTYSRSKSGFTGGSPSATVLPTDATTAYTLWSAATFWDTTPGRLLISAETSSPYGIFAFTIPIGGGNIKTIFWDEPLASGTYITDDADPFLAGAYYNSTGISAAGGSFIVSPSSGIISYKRYRHGISSPSNVRIDYLFYRPSGNTTPVAPASDSNNQVGVDPFNNKEIPLPILISRPAATGTATGYVGILNRQKWGSVGGRSNGQTLYDSDSSLYWIHCGGVWVPWDSSTPSI